MAQVISLCTNHSKLFSPQDYRKEMIADDVHADSMYRNNQTSKLLNNLPISHLKQVRF